jgi:hypothetical protein
MIIRLILNAIQEWRGNPDGTRSPNGKLVAMICFAVVAALIIFGALMPDGFRPIFRVLRLFLR